MHHQYEIVSPLATTSVMNHLWKSMTCKNQKKKTNDIKHILTIEQLGRWWVYSSILSTWASGGLFQNDYEVHLATLEGIPIHWRDLDPHSDEPFVSAAHSGCFWTRTELESSLCWRWIMNIPGSSLLSWKPLMDAYGSGPRINSGDCNTAGFRNFTPKSTIVINHH